MKEAGVVATSDPQTALADASLVLSLVTAGDALSVAEDYAPYLMKGAIWCDMNLVAPQTKADASKVVEQNGGRSVDVAVLTPVHLAHIAVRSEEHTYELQSLLRTSYSGSCLTNKQ